ncbi:MAG: glutamine--fructose-6-phosphate transaminase (isomerizing) [Parcubacteria group bacterium]|jgi:glucosamine--fructose-6-phosphate aminotransferase (isomerizing)
MCGIVGYIGKQKAAPILVDGLKRLEYRGYDSSGIAVLDDQRHVFLAKAMGKIAELEKKIGGEKIDGNIGIAHTRWATHGAPSEINAHPHCDCKGKIWLVHNGIIENYQQIKKRLLEKKHIFKSETDTEVLAHLIEEMYDGNLTEAVEKSLKIVKGTYGIVVFHSDEPGKIIAAKKGSPLIIGLGENETIIASDVSAILRYTKQVIYLDDGEMAEISKEGMKIFDADNAEINKDINEVEWNLDQAEKGGYPHFLIKEIFEQPETIANSVRGRLIYEDGNARLGGISLVADKIRNIDRIIIVACGTARCAALVGEYMLEEYAGIPTEVDYAHEFRYRKQVLDNKTAVIVMSQSGETADTLAAVKESKEKGILTLGIVNAVGSSIARGTDAGVYNHVGPEISVASTKAFTSQIAILSLLTLFMGRQRDMSLVTGQRIVKEILELPDKIKKILETSDQIKNIAEKYSKYTSFAYLGRKYNHPMAFEGAIKLKELSYIHAEGFAAGEMKHGPIAMIDENFPSFYFAPQDSVYEKNISNMQEIKARGGKIIVVATEGDEKIREVADDVIYIPKTLEMLTPILSAVPAQLFAYHMAVLKGLDVDKPRNLAKSVTVE